MLRFVMPIMHDQILQKQIKPEKGPFKKRKRKENPWDMGSQKRHTQHSVCSLWGTLSFHFQRVYNPLVPLCSDAGHSENARHNSGGLNKGDCFAHQHTYKHVQA